MPRFTKGQSGNPAGRRKGTVTRATLLKRELATSKESIVSKVITMALKGDRFCLKLCIERLIPMMKSSAQLVNIPIAQNPLSVQVQDLYKYAATGRISVDEAKALADILSAAARVKEVDETEKRLAEIERRMEGIENVNADETN
jgi:Family of unknown function (DUF5681)